MYAELREMEATQQVPHGYTTARTLLSILRLAQALTRLRFERAVAQVCHVAQLATFAPFSCPQCQWCEQPGDLAKLQTLDGSYYRMSVSYD